MYECPLPSAAPGDPLAATTATPAVYIGGSQLFTLWSGLAPGFVGVYQVNVQVPASLKGRGTVNIVLTVDGKTANTVTINAQ